MRLQEKLQHIQQNMAQQVPEHVLNAFAQSLGQLMEQNLEKRALKVGDIAPDFTLPSIDGKPISLYRCLQEGKVILNFFRGNWCPFCMAELEHYQETVNNNMINNAIVLAISPQIIEFNKTVTSEKNLTFNVLSDQDNKVAKQYGLVFALQENVRDIYKALGADLELFNGNNTYQLPIPATYVVDRDKKIIFASVNTNYMERADICDIRDTL